MAREVKHVDTKQMSATEAKQKKPGVSVYNGSTYSALDLVRAEIKLKKTISNLQYIINEEGKTNAYLEFFNNSDFKGINKAAKLSGDDNIFEASNKAMDVVKKFDKIVKVYNRELESVVRRVSSRHKEIV